MIPRVWTNFDPRGMVGRIYVGDHWTLLYIILCVVFVALPPKSTAMVIAGRSVHLTTLFSWASNLGS